MRLCFASKRQLYHSWGPGEIVAKTAQILTVRLNYLSAHVALMEKVQLPWTPARGVMSIEVPVHM